MKTNEPDPMLDPHSPEEPDSFNAMLSGAALIFIVAFIPFVFYTCCLPHIIGALLAVYLYSSKYSLTLPTGQGIKLGIQTCLLGGLASWAVAMGLYFALDYQMGAKESQWIAVTMAQKFGGPEAVEKTMEALEQQRAAGLSTLQILGGFFGTLVFSSVSGLIGGSIGAALFKRGPENQ